MKVKIKRISKNFTLWKSDYSNTLINIIVFFKSDFLKHEDYKAMIEFAN